MQSEAIENLKNQMNDRVVKHFDPLLKVQSTLDFLSLLDSNINEDSKQKIARLSEWSSNIFSTGNIACNLNIILQNQNLALFAENEKLKEENKKLLSSLEWNQI